MKNHFVPVVLAAALAIVVAIISKTSLAQSPAQPVDSDAVIADSAGAKTAGSESAPLFLTEIPAGYRDWKLISVAREEGTLDDIRAVLGNDIAIKAYRAGEFPLPDGSVIVRLAWSFQPSEENNKAFGRSQSFVAGTPKNGIQFMVKDSKKYAATGGWGYGQFDDGKPAGESVMKNCFSCHQAVESRALSSPATPLERFNNSVASKMAHQMKRQRRIAGGDGWLNCPIICETGYNILLNPLG